MGMAAFCRHQDEGDARTRGIGREPARRISR
jgi:hypothetical protein